MHVCDTQVTLQLLVYFTYENKYNTNIPNRISMIVLQYVFYSDKTCWRWNQQTGIQVIRCAGYEKIVLHNGIALHNDSDTLIKQFEL